MLRSGPLCIALSAGLTLLACAQPVIAAPDPFAYTMMVTPEEGPLDPLVQSSYTQAFAQCQDAAQITSDNAACFEAEFTRQDQRLNVAWVAAFRATVPAKRAALRQAQRLWAASRDPFCRKESDGYAGGTIAPVIWSGCRVELTIRRTLWLEHIATARR